MSEYTTGVDKHYSHSVQATDETGAKEIFDTAVARLLDVNTWHQTAGSGTAVFQRMNAEGFALTGNTVKVDYWRISIPGHGSNFDWVKVEHICAETDKIEIRVRPCADPTAKDKSTAHFLDDAATSTFIVKKTGLEVSAIVLGQNESPNTEGESLWKKARNLVVGAGAIFGIAGIQWNKLAAGLLDTAITLQAGSSAALRG